MPSVCSAVVLVNHTPWSFPWAAPNADVFFPSLLTERKRSFQYRGIA